MSGTHKKYAKTSRAGKKSNNSNSRLYDQVSNAGSNSSKFSPSGYGSRQGIDTGGVHTKSYNSIMTALINKEQEIYKSTASGFKSSHMKSSTNTPSSNSKLGSNSRVRHADSESFKRSTEPKSFKKSEITLYTSKPGDKKLKNDLEDYLKTSRTRHSRNYLTHTSSAHTYKTHR